MKRWNQVVGTMLAVGALLAWSSDLRAAEPNPLSAFLAKFCVDCHGPSEAQRGLRLDQLPPAFAEAETAAKWIKILDQVSQGEMPPSDASQPPAKDRAAAVKWLREQLHAASL